MGKRQDRSSRDGSASGAGLRSLRLEQLFREELISILDSDVNDERLADVRVTRVELSRDGSRARVGFTTRSREHGSSVETTELALLRATGFLRRRLCEALPLKRTPELRFRYEPLALEPERVPSAGPAEAEGHGSSTELF
jgi:ribosome-binding factor A